MRPVLLLSDIHGNLPALDAVIEDASARQDFAAVWVLGDSVGYGAQPNQVVDRLRSLQNLTIVKGNHEAAAIGEMSVATFNPIAGSAALWTARTLTDDYRDYLARLPEIVVEKSVTLCHGTPRDPIWEYMLDSSVAEENLRYFSTTGCVYGHTHVPAVFGRTDQGRWQQWRGRDSDIVELGFERWYVNPGSVGQPRDRDPRASYSFLFIGESDEPSRVEFHRVEYDVSHAQDLILAAGLPAELAFRLSQGY